MDDGPIFDRDDDVIIGRKGILHFLQLASWEAVQNRIRNEGLPVQKIAGRIELSKEKYRIWRDGKMDVSTKNGEPAGEEIQKAEHKDVLLEDFVRAKARKLLQAAIETEVSACFKETVPATGVIDKEGAEGEGDAKE